jgi:hypothetical protein
LLSRRRFREEALHAACSYSLLLAIAAAATACGAEDSTAPNTPPAPNFIRIESDAGEPLGQGRTFNYTQANARITVTARAGYLRIGIEGDEWWAGDFQLPAALGRFQPGSYTNLERFPFHNPANGGLSWIGGGRGCGGVSGSFTVDLVSYTDSVLTAIDLRFEQHCDAQPPALRGTIHWRSDDPTEPPGPVNPIPANLWKPLPGSTPVSGNYAYLTGDVGDPVFGGQTTTYTQANALIILNSGQSYLSLMIKGDENWQADFKAMNTLSQLQPGYYPDAGRFPFQNPVRSGLAWSGEGISCNRLTGWFAVDSIVFTSGVLTVLDLRFEQHCEGYTPALRGVIHWRSGDMTRPAGPVHPIPTRLWKPAPGSAPSAGNYVYLESEPGDRIGGGKSYTYTQASAIIVLSAVDGTLSVEVRGDESWHGNFQTMNTLTRLEPGYYPDLRRYPFHNPARGGLDWGGEGNGCNTLTGWFAVDSVTYVSDVLIAVDLRFEQHCGGATSALHGMIHWRHGDPTTPPGPVNPIPSNLWTPAAGSAPVSGNYVYLGSDAGDFVGRGQTYLYTQTNSTIVVDATAGHLALNVNGVQFWHGNFQTMNTLTRLEPGYYPDLRRYPFHNPVKGGLDWSGDGRGCNQLIGWFAIDRVTYANGVLSGLDLRFEQHCERGTPALRGAIHWDR